MSQLTVEQDTASATSQLEKNELANFSVHLLGRRITFMTVPAIVKAINAACVSGRQITVANYNVHSFNLSMQIPWFYEFLQSADITHCDGMGILKVVRYLGIDLPSNYRVSYSILMPALLQHCNDNGLSVFLLGAKQTNLESALREIREQYPNIAIQGHHGYFDPNDSAENAAVVQQINAVKPNILIVGMGMPTQEDWIRQNRSSLETNVILPGGAVIDRLAGEVPDCPPVLSNVGLEWLYRLTREPKRLAMRYLVGNPAFVLHIALAAACLSPSEVVQTQSVQDFDSRGTRVLNRGLREYSPEV